MPGASRNRPPHHRNAGERSERISNTQEADNQRTVVRISNGTVMIEPAHRGRAVDSTLPYESNTRGGRDLRAREERDRELSPPLNAFELSLGHDDVKDAMSTRVVMAQLHSVVQICDDLRRNLEAFPDSEVFWNDRRSQKLRETANLCKWVLDTLETANGVGRYDEWAQARNSNSISELALTDAASARAVLAERSREWDLQAWGEVSRITASFGQRIDTDCLAARGPQSHETVWTDRRL